MTGNVSFTPRIVLGRYNNIHIKQKRMYVKLRLNMKNIVSFNAANQQRKGWTYFYLSHLKLKLY